MESFLAQTSIFRICYITQPQVMSLKPSLGDPPSKPGAAPLHAYQKMNARQHLKNLHLWF
jgi:hypothetical protein